MSNNPDYEFVGSDGNQSDGVRAREILRRIVQLKVAVQHHGKPAAEAIDTASLRSIVDQSPLSEPYATLVNDALQGLERVHVDPTALNWTRGELPHVAECEMEARGKPTPMPDASEEEVV